MVHHLVLARPLQGARLVCTAQVCYPRVRALPQIIAPSNTTKFLHRYAQNKQHNRFLDVLPNPVTRVPLEQVGDDPTTTYINANYVRNYDGYNDRAYIASMG